MMKVTDKQISYNIIMILYALNINDAVSVSVCVCMCVCVGWGWGDLPHSAACTAVLLSCSFQRSCFSLSPNLT